MNERATGAGCEWRIKRLAVVLCSAGLTVGLPQTSVRATEGDPSGNAIPARLSLADAQRLAFKRNWDLLASAAGVDAVEAQKIVARQLPNPTLSMSSTKINLEGPNSTPAGNGLWDRSYDSTFAVNQLLEIGGKRRNRKASAQAGFEQARAQFLDVKRSLDLGVAKAYVAAALAEETVEVLRRSADTLHQEAKLAEIRLQAGEISAADKTQIEMTAERFELDASAAQSAAAQARISLELLLGSRQPQGAFVLSDKLETLSGSWVKPSPEADMLRRPDVLAAEAAVRKAEADLRLQKANRVPDPTLMFQYEHEPPDLPTTIGFGVSFPLPLWTRNRGNIQAAEAAREQTRLNYEKAKAEAFAEAVSARLAYENAVKRWREYGESIRPKSEQVRQTLAYAYQKGGASLLDMLVAERNDNEVRLAAIQAAGDTVVAIATVQAATLTIAPSELSR